MCSNLNLLPISEMGSYPFPGNGPGYGSAPFVVAATLFVYTRHRQSPANVSLLLLLVWCEMRCLCWERVMCEKKAKKDAPATVVTHGLSRQPSAVISFFLGF